MDTHVVVLAAGRGTRMKSRLPKVLHRVAGLPLIEHVLRVADAITPASITVVVGHGAAEVRGSLAERQNLSVVVQEPQLGTGHALQQAEPGLTGRTGTIVLLSGDVPLLRAATLTSLLDTHARAGAAATVLTARVAQPYGYGRIVREGGAIARIVEERDATPAERALDEINSGIYALDAGPLFDALRGIAAGNAQGEIYLTDLVGAYRRRGLPVATALMEDGAEIAGINTRAELASAARIMRARTNAGLMAAGVTLVDPDATYVDVDAAIGPDTVIHPNVTIEGRTTIGAGCEIRSHVRIADAVLEDGVTVNDASVIVRSRIGAGASVGPFAHVRPESVVGAAGRVGNFVELKKTVLGPGSKANHLSYLGDATIGAGVNIGAGTITCNYDGTSKLPTVIEDGAFIGSDSQLVAPVRVGQGAYVAAGSSVVEDVPPGALGIARARQTNVPGWVERRKRR